MTMDSTKINDNGTCENNNKIPDLAVLYNDSQLHVIAHNICGRY